MIDPVNNFEIPHEWIKRSKLHLNELNKRISSGRYVLLSDGTLLKRGLTTGTTASAAAKASVLSLKKDVSEITVRTPVGLLACLPVLAKNGKASVFKEPGDHASDVTGGIEIIANARESDNITIKAGPGIGRKNGRPAINPEPMKQIEGSIKEALSETGLKGAHVMISVPGGEIIAKETLNEKIGIYGGISILGTTGFVEPWNEHLGETKEQIIRNTDRLVLTTGRLGMRFSNMIFPDHTVILIGSDISRGLEAARDEVILCGLPGLILKWACPDILKNSGYLTIQEMVADDPGNPLIDMAFGKAVMLSGQRVVVLNRNGTILRDSGGIK